MSASKEELIMKNAFYAIAAATLMLGGCSGEMARDHGKATAPGDIGSLDLKLTTPEGYVINSATYSVTGGGLTSPRTNTMDLTNSSQLRFQVGNLPIATGYTIALTATSTNTGTSIPCAGTAPFDIANNQVTTVALNLVCSGQNVIEVDGNGDIRVSVAVSVDAGITCPVVTGISALPLETAVGSTLQLEGFTSSAGPVAWSGPGGTFASASSAATGYTCTTGGDHDLTFTVSVPGCPASAYGVQVTCTGDAGTPPPVDSGVDSGPAPVDSGVDSGPEVDSGPAPVDSGVDSGPDPLSACQQCVRAPASPCRDWFFSGPDNVADCFENADPTWVERCVALYRCAVTAPDNCAADPTGVTKCYCGTTSIETCFTGASTSLPNGECIDEVNAATQCTTPQCVEGLLNSPERPSYSAYYLTLCTASPDACGPQCPLPRPASL
jgi:hypothetical protein